MIIDNSKKVYGALRVGLSNALEDIADLICEYAIRNCPVNTGNLQRSISSRAQMGSSFQLTKTQMDKVSGEWVETKVPSGEFIHVPHNYVRSLGGGSMEIEYGAYATYASAVEHGQAPHVIRPDSSRGYVGGKVRKNPHLRFMAGGREVFAKEVHHPGTRAQPFMRPAVEQAKGQLQDVISQAVQNEMYRQRLVSKEDEDD